MLLVGGCSVPNPPDVPKVGAGEAALTARLPAAAAKAGAEVVGEPKPAIPTVGAPAPNAAMAVPPKDGTPPSPNAGAGAPTAGAEALLNERPDAPNAGTLDVPNAGALDAANAGVLDVPKAGALPPKLGALLADPKPPKPVEAVVEAEPNVAAPAEPNAGAGPEPKPANDSVKVNQTFSKPQSGTAGPSRCRRSCTKTCPTAWRKGWYRPGAERRRGAACKTKRLMMESSNDPRRGQPGRDTARHARTCSAKIEAATTTESHAEIRSYALQFAMICWS